jgi:acetolactate synthase-1/2/3 large subunit
MKKKIKISDLIVKFFEEKKTEHVFLLSGGMMMHLLESLSKSDKLKYICNHHEQASSIAAESYARVKNQVGVCFATSGPGSTNIVTGVAGAYLDSTPMVFITGQSRTTLTARGSGINNLRMVGNFEVDIVEIVKPITKYSYFLDNANHVLFHLEKAFYLATHGRPGPVLLDCPLDIQGSVVNEDDLIHFKSTDDDVNDLDLKILLEDLKKYKKPLILAGHGIRVANQVNEFIDMVTNLQIPVVTTQLANDLIEYQNELYIGKVGLRGDRAGNFAVQDADLLISIGCSLHVTTTGYDEMDFAPQAKKVVIDIDEAVLEKNKKISQLQIKCDIANLIKILNSKSKKLYSEEWLLKLKNWKIKYQIINEPHFRKGNQINTYHFINDLSEKLNGSEVVITDAGSLYYIVGQAFKVKHGQRVIISGALGAMGYALPASIGAAFANPDKNVICLTGDGSMQLNIQELQTIFNYNLNCKIIVINNNGYASIRSSQSSFFNGNIVGASEETGVTFPNWEKIANAYSIPYKVEGDYSNLSSLFKDILEKKGPILVEILVPEEVIMMPSVTSIRLENGLFKSNKLDEMSPYLDNYDKPKE